MTLAVRARTIADMLNTSDAAKSLGLVEFTIRRLCKKHGIGERLGSAPPSGAPDNRPWVLTAADVVRLKSVAHPTAGRPKTAEIQQHPRRKRRKSLSRKE